jgi:hypothetical protein
MPSRLKHCFLFCVLLLSSMPTAGQSDAGTSAKLFRRYERGASVSRLSEDVLTLTLSVGKERPNIGIRVCSKEPLPLALVTANADPFLIGKLLGDGYGFSPDRIIYLRAEDCLSAQPLVMPVTEVWIIPQGASLPSHVDAATGGQVRKTSLGKEEVNRGVRDYKVALQQLIRDLRANPNTVGVVFGYFLDHPSQVLRRRLREVSRILKHSALSKDRFLVMPMAWTDEISTYPRDREPTYPSLYVVEVVNGSDAVRK